MKKYLCCVAAILVASCSSHPENATENNAVDVVKAEVQNSRLADLIDALRGDEDLRAQLNALTSQGNATGGAIDACGDKVLSEAYSKRNGSPVLDTRAKIDQGIAILKGIPETGAKYESKNLSKIEALSAKLDSASGAVPFVLSDEDIRTLTTSLHGVDEEITYDDLKSKVIGSLKGADCENMLPRYCAWSKALVTAGADRLNDAAELDALLTCDLVGWARELRLNYPQNDYAFDRFRKFVNDDVVVKSRVVGFVGDLAKSGPKKAFERLAPPDEQYQKLIDARKVYLKAIEDGGWVKVDDVPKTLEASVGKSYTWVPGLKKRLAQEGYTVGNVESDVFDEPTRAAVELYRDVHQLNQKKLVDSTLVKNMAVPPETRLESIDLTIQRYRESAIGSLSYYVKVNIPEFYAEVWKDGTRIARHKIVVGNNNIEKDPETKQPVPDPVTLYPLHPNRTPIQTSKINEVILNPYWNVPARIRQQELEPKLAANPNYYAENNYEEVNVGDPKLYYVRELPNPKNSLGRVKMMFPNPHNTYLHDTPAKAAFNNPLRALSHGCMRVQNPLDLAKLLLENDGQYDAAKVNSILNANPLVETSIMLNKPVDVDVVYFNTRVDDSGVVAFLSDVYEYDAIRLGKVVLKKLPKPKGWK